MTIDFVMPKLAMAMNEGTVDQWLVEHGAYVEQGTEIATVETEKVAYDIEAPVSGYLQIIIENGTTVPVETIIARFCDEQSEVNDGTTPSNTNDTEVVAIPSAATQVSIPEQQPAPVGQATQVLPEETQSSGRIIASPVAKKLARVNNLSLENLKGTGPGGRIIKVDVEQALAQPRQALSNLTASNSQDNMAVRDKISLKGLRKTIATNMVKSLQSSAQLTNVWDADIEALKTARQAFVAKEEHFGTRVSLNAFFIKALATAAKQYPIVNSSLINDEISIFEHVNVGFAVEIPGQSAYETNLILPVIHRAELKTVLEIDRELKALISLAKEGKLTAEQCAGSTIAFTNVGSIAPAGLYGTPILNLPNAVIVGVAAPALKPMVVNGEVTPRTMLPVSVTFDHRHVDGAPSARFQKFLCDCLENPSLMLA
jgi:pyruvate/2-oxoglutarate dehydrogenase complex dihydrolipoamide acyltransferase (E2) component